MSGLGEKKLVIIPQNNRQVPETLVQLAICVHHPGISQTQDLIDPNASLNLEFWILFANYCEIKNVTKGSLVRHSIFYLDIRELPFIAHILKQQCSSIENFFVACIWIID